MLKKFTTPKRKLKREKVVWLKELTILHVEDLGVGAVKVPVVEWSGRGAKKFGSGDWREDSKRRLFAVKDEVMQIVGRAFVMDWSQPIPEDQIKVWEKAA